MTDKEQKKILAEAAKGEGCFITSCGCMWILYIVIATLVFACPIIGIPMAILLFVMEKQRRQWVKDEIRKAEED